MDCCIGIDIGTSGCKTLAIDTNGTILASFTHAYPLYQPRPGYSEQNPEDWYNAALNGIKDVLQFVDAASVSGIGLCGQMHGMIALDSANQIVRPAILWNDQRTQVECDDITTLCGGISGLLQHTSNRMLTGYTGGKILWMKRHEPRNYAKTQIIINPKDYIRLRLSGELTTDVSDASGTGLFDVKHRIWATDLIEMIGLNRRLFPAVVESTGQTGSITKQAATETGLPTGIPVFGGGGDAVLSILSSGILEPGRMGITLGTSGVVATGLAQYKDNPDGALQLFCGNEPGQYVAFGCTLSAAGSFEWLYNLFFAYEEQRGSAPLPDIYALLNQVAKQAPPAAGGLLFLPYLNGERCPLFDSSATASFLNLNATMSLPHIARSVMEGVCFSMRHVYEYILACTDTQPSRVTLSGGGAKSALWRDILSSVLGLPIDSNAGEDAGGAFGAALLAGIGLGIWQDAKEATAFMRLKESARPDKNLHNIYNDAYAKYLVAASL